MWKDSFTCLKYLGYPRIKAFDNPKYAYIYGTSICYHRFYIDIYYLSILVLAT